MSVINKYFNKLDKLTNNYDLEFTDDFDNFLLKYNVNKNTKITNSKIFFLLKIHLKKELEQLYISYIRSFNNDNEDEPNIYNTSQEQILKETQAYIKFKYDELLTNDIKFKLIKEIEQKYNITNEDNITVRYI